MDEPALNQRIAEKLREAADLLEQQGANPFRIGAYRRAAETVAGLDRDLAEMVEREGPEHLVELPNIGKGIASAVLEMVATGRWSQLDRLRGALDPVHLFQTLPGIGPDLAQRIHDTLEVDSLEALEVAAHDGSLATVPGLGPRRVAAIRAELAGLLGRVRGRRAPAPATGPAAGTVLEVDAEYRQKASAGELPTIAPKRFNPEGEASLPVLHTQRDGWHFSAMYSNTARAHELKRTRDWVVVYFYDDHHQEGQHTVVTENRGPLAGQRVVRGREAEYRQFYAKG
jgi:DNA polymerase (family 10)